MSAVSCSSSSADSAEPSTGVPPSQRRRRLRAGQRAAVGAAGRSPVPHFSVRTRLRIVSFRSHDSTSPYRYSKELVRPDQRLGQRIDLGLGIVHGERGPARRRDAEPLHQRLRAVVAGAHRDARAVDDGRDVVRVQPVDAERDDGALARRRAVDLEPVQLAEPGMRIGATARPRGAAMRSRPTCIM